MSWINESRVRVALQSPRGELLRLMVAQPYRGSACKHLITGKAIMAPERLL